MKDPIVEEVRRVREEILREFGGDFSKYLDYLRIQEKKRGKRVVRRKHADLSKLHEQRRATSK